MSFSAPQLPLQNLKLNRYSFTSANARGVIICLDNGYLLSNAAPNAVGSLCHKGVKLAHFLRSTTLLWILSCRAVVQNDQKFRYWACFEKKKKKKSFFTSPEFPVSEFSQCYKIHYKNTPQPFALETQQAIYSFNSDICFLSFCFLLLLSPKGKRK